MNIINEQLRLIKEINALMDLEPKSPNETPIPNLNLHSLLHELERLGTEPLHQEIERMRLKYIEAANRNIPNLNKL